MSNSIQDLHEVRVLRDAGDCAPDSSRTSGLHCFGVSLFGFAIHVEAPSQEWIDLLEKHVFPSVPRVASIPAYADLRVHVDQHGNLFRLYRNGELVASAPCVDDLARSLIDCVDRAFIDRLKNLYAVHAGAVLFGDRALLLPGGSHAGKSSLVAELLRRGAVCLSDEYALIDGAGMVHAYPRPLLLRNGGHEQTPVLPGQLNAKLADAPARVGWILSIRYQAGGTWVVDTVPQSLALLSLLKNTPHALADSPRMVGSFERAVAGARVFEGHRGEVSDAADRILELVARN